MKDILGQDIQVKNLIGYGVLARGHNNLHIGVVKNVEARLVQPILKEKNWRTNEFEYRLGRVAKLRSWNKAVVLYAAQIENPRIKALYEQVVNKLP